jgi:hypothetical protein
MPIHSGMVKAYQSAEEGAYPVVDSTGLSETGEYRFTGLASGSYMFRVFPGQIDQGEGIPTYLGDVASWNNATILEVDSAYVDTLLDIRLLEKLPTHPGDRIGSMSGNISYKDSVVDKGTLSKPVTRSSVILVRKSSRKGTQGENVFDYMETDDKGNYIFSYIPEGGYKLIVDIAGLAMLNTYDVTIDSGRVVTGLDFVVGSTWINTADRVDVETLSTDRIMIFPNPGSGQLHIHLPAMGDYRLEVINAMGQLVQSGEFPSAGGLVLMDVSALDDGIYFIKIEGNTWTETLKYLKE